MEVVYKMNHEAYIGKSLRELVADCPDYGLNFYEVFYKDRFHLKNILNNEKLMSKRIKEIKTMHMSYEYWITLEDF
jgi:hypothetical protein